MILASLADSAQYESLHPLFHQAFEYVKQNDLAQAPAGKIVLDGDRLFISVSDVTGKIADEAKLESHAKYIDIQIPLTASETIGFLPACECKNSPDGYNAAKDITFFTDKPSAYVQVKPGQFVVFFPHDGHAPCIGEGAIRKLVVKVLV
jgi:YhcH/YjgK/YiaL family protein